MESICGGCSCGGRESETDSVNDGRENLRCGIAVLVATVVLIVILVGSCRAILGPEL